MDISISCRGCMKKVASWEKGNFDDRTVQMFSYCTNIEVGEDDKLPKQFCYDCFIKIESSYTFIREAQKVNVMLKNIVSRSDTSIIVQTEHSKYMTSQASLPDVKLNILHNNLSEQLIYKQKDYYMDDIPTGKNLTISLKHNFESEHEETTVNDLPSPVPFPDKVDDISSNICVLCRKCFDSEISLSDHIKSDHKYSKDIVINDEVECFLNTDQNPKHACPFCKKSFKFKKWMNRHIAKEHSSATYTCDKCSKTFSKFSELREHALSHSETRPHACATCPARFKRRKQLTAHTRTHSELRPYACPHCPMRFKVKSVLKTHLDLHSGTKKHLCYICGSIFSQAGNLSVHMRGHAGVGRSRSRARARSRTRRHCAVCARAFHDISALKRHTRTHTGERPYKCGACPRTFIDSWKRKAHMMRAHSVPLAALARLPRVPAPSTSGDTGPLPQ